MARRDSEPSGYGSLIAIGIVLLLSALVLAWASPFLYRVRVERSQLDAAREDRAFEEKAVSLLRELDKSSQGETDRMLQWIPPEGATLRDSSGLLNPNWIRKQFFVDSPLKTLFRLGSPDELQAFRAKESLSNDARRYERYFAASDLARFFTLDSPLNPNTVDEFVFESVMGRALGDAAEGTRWRENLRRLRSEGKVLKGEAETRLWFGGVWDRAKAFSTWLPDWNVNSMDPFLLQSVLAFKDFAIPSPEAAFNSLMSIRASRHIKPEDLRSILHIQPDNRAWIYLGTESSFWTLSLREASGRGIELVFRKRSEGSEGGSFQILARRYFHA